MPDGSNTESALQHNHIFQVKPRNAQFDCADCPACSSIDFAVMDSWYAQAWHARLKVEAELARQDREDCPPERALSSMNEGG